MKNWDINVPDRKIVNELMLKCGLTSFTASVLASRGFKTAESVLENYSINELSDPLLIADMQAAADTINYAVDNGEKICVYGDYDCDGIMSTVMLYTYLTEIGADVIYYIPERSDGYGLNIKAIDQLSEDKISLIITVDNGISAIDEADHIYENNMKLVVTDHHQPGDALPKAEAVVDPHRSDCFSTFKFLCGAGVVLKLIAALDGGDYTMALEQFGDLAAIATIADIVKLSGENRFIAAYGMQLIENTDREALAEMKKICGLDGKKIDSVSIGFGIAPRINASGRFGSPNTAVKLFLSEDEDEIRSLAEELDSLNKQRKEEELNILKEIYAEIDRNPMIIHERVIYICGKDWHHGVIGIVASKISERFGKPCFLASEVDGEIRGSARAFGNFSVYEALKYCNDALEKFGGHTGAGGFTVKQNCSEKFNELLQRYARSNHKIMPLFTVKADTPISPAELTVKNIDGLSVLEPFGEGNEKPLFYLENTIVKDIYPLSNGAHSRLLLKFGYMDIYAVIFRTSPESLSIKKGDSCNLIVNLDVNRYNNKESINIIIKDYRNCAVEQSKFFAASIAYENFLRKETLPSNFYKSMYPIRDEVVSLYLKIPSEGIEAERLFLMMKNPAFNFCKFSVALEALRQLNLIEVTSADNVVKKVKVSHKVDLQTAPILIELKSKIQ